MLQLQLIMIMHDVVDVAHVTFELELRRTCVYALTLTLTVEYIYSNRVRYYSTGHGKMLNNSEMISIAIADVVHATRSPSPSNMAAGSRGRAPRSRIRKQDS